MKAVASVTDAVEEVVPEEHALAVRQQRRALVLVAERSHRKSTSTQRMNSKIEIASEMGDRREHVHDPHEQT